MKKCGFIIFYNDNFEIHYRYNIYRENDSYSILREKLMRSRTEKGFIQLHQLFNSINNKNNSDWTINNRITDSELYKKVDKLLCSAKI